MKIFVFSDTHGDIDGMDLIISMSKPDLIIHLGDLINDALKIQNKYSDIQMIIMRGNADNDDSFVQEKHINIYGKNIYITHGDQFNHGQGVTRSAPESEMVTHAMQNNIDIVLYGHIHTPVLSLERGIFVMNPGSASNNKIHGFYPTFGLIELYENNVICKILSVEMFKYLIPAR
jgi:putative phosphoesterase